MEIINQTKENTCLACVLAMMVNESEQYVLDWFGDISPPKQDEDAFIFLAHHGLYLVSLADFTKISMDGKGIYINGREIFRVKFSLETHKAYIVVDSPNREDTTHAVFWDGEMILDPLYLEPQRLEKYKIQHIYPLLTTEQRMVKSTK